MHKRYRWAARNGGLRRMIATVSPALMVAVGALTCSIAAAQPASAPVVHPDARLLFNGWGVTPVGRHTPISDMPLKMVVSRDGKTLAALSAGYNRTGLSLLDIASRRVNQFVPIPRCFNGIAFSADGKTLYVTGSNSGKLYAYPFADGRVGDAREATPAVGPGAGTGVHFLAGAAVAPTTGRLYVCDEGADSVLEIDPTDLSLVHMIPTGAHPHTCVFGADPRYLYVSNWGGRSVSVIDTNTDARVRDIDVGLRPNDMALGPDGRLFVACSGDNTVHVLQTRTLETPEPGASPNRRPAEGVREIISTSLYPASPEGSTPDAVAVSPDGKTLYVANADNNDVMVTDISNAAEARPMGFLPVGWYPTALAVSPDGGTLFTAEGKGLRSVANYPDPIAKGRGGKAPRFAYIANLLQGYVSFIDRPTAEQLAKGTEQVRRNSPYTPATLRESVVQGGSVIPAAVGAPCPIKYVLYIIKENRTYDQVFGDLKDAAGHALGNGDPALVMYGEGVTPNHHQLARDYVVLDNLYCNG
ncbi:MAG: YncE family protein, partial [Chloroflexi bacterium]|nr:YncE family protein [Chloroflexota bacterium]